ncbi:DUF4339 domain-containing protein [Candidatus Collinsella stercoripullorum]|uniref:DUF4339 domain-containing protein n=1 Tax=Candidatus Collinsella stercoripullorum TaxID=2838522 RepID=UPI0022E88C6D|nr:DUF4339 domain-containing protein [Candidatus Collinsella stercoripullorum]
MSEPSFYSIDRLVEFGLSLGVATQMAQSMNAMLQEMCVPGANNSLQAAQMPQGGQLTPTKRAPESFQCGQPVYYAVLDGKVAGPFSIVELARLVVEKRVVKETYIWTPGMADWGLAEAVPDVLQLVALTPPPVPDAG